MLATFFLVTLVGFSASVCADGLEREFYPDGKPRRIAWREGGVDAVLVRFDGRGLVAEITCARGRNLIPELQERCGFAGRRAQTVIDDGGGDQRRLTFDKGLLVERETHRNGRLESSEVFREGEKVRRSFHTNGKLEMESVTRVNAEGLDVSPRNMVIKSFDVDGRLKLEVQRRGDVTVVEDLWYANGVKRQEIRRSRNESSPRRELVTVTRRFHENGRLIDETRTESPPDPRAVVAEIERLASAFPSNAFERAAFEVLNAKCAKGDEAFCALRNMAPGFQALCVNGDAPSCKLAYCWLDPGSTRCLEAHRRASGDGWFENQYSYPIASPELVIVGVTCRADYRPAAVGGWNSQAVYCQSKAGPCWFGTRDADRAQRFPSLDEAARAMCRARR